MESELSPEFVAKVLSQPPFVTIAGVVNVRDLGLYPSAQYSGKVTKPRFLLRSGEVSGIKASLIYQFFPNSLSNHDPGKKDLIDMGITTIFDLRSDVEITKYNSPLPKIDKVEVVRVPVFKSEDYSPEMMAKRFALYASGKTEAFMVLYSQILDHGGPAFGAILRRIRDRPDEGCLFHCTAGKDRTGVIAAIILKFAGVADETIAYDYSLTKIGREPIRALIMQRLAKEPTISNNEAAMNMLESKAETMLAFLDLLNEKYGGAEEYVKHYADLTDEDIAKIKSNILVSQ